MNPELAKTYFIDLLQRAHGGELAAAYAYHGHASSVRRENEKEEITKIEKEEWHHRSRIRSMMESLSVRPRRFLEVKFFLIGKTISFLCHVGGWFIPMYGAGKLERGNIVEYEVAARLAHIAGYPQYIDELLSFAETEWDHEQYYRDKINSHWLCRWVKPWLPPPPRSKIREEFDLFLKTNHFHQFATGIFTVNKISRYFMKKSSSKESL